MPRVVTGPDLLGHLRPALAHSARATRLSGRGETGLGWDNLRKRGRRRHAVQTLAARTASSQWRDRPAPSLGVHVMVQTGQQTPDSSKNSQVGVLMNGSRTKVFWIQIVYLAALAVIAGVYFAGQLPAWLASPQGAGLSVQPGVLFFGALGGVLLSLEGVFQHGHNWDETYFLWHIARPFVGAAVAVVAVLILQAGILAVGVQPAGAGSSQTTGATPVDKDLLYYVVAFLVGYREESFRGLIKKAADLIFTSPTAAAAPAISSIVKSDGLVAGGETVKISGSGFTGTTAVRFGPWQAKFTVNSDVEIQATTPQADAAGRVSVLVVSPGGTAVAPQLFEFK
jgi:hypothetical protein